MGGTVLNGRERKLEEAARRGIVSGKVKEISGGDDSRGGLTPIDIKESFSVEEVHYLPLSQVDSNYRIDGPPKIEGVESGGGFVDRVTLQTIRVHSRGDKRNSGLREEQLIFGVVVSESAVVDQHSSNGVTFRRIHTIEVIGGGRDSTLHGKSLFNVAENYFSDVGESGRIDSKDFTGARPGRVVEILSLSVESDGKGFD